jgi:hypothetical protein
MNERIRLLAEQAEQYALDKANEANDEDYDYSFDDDFQEKFAELIVERLCYDMMDVCGATQAERIQFVAKNWGVEL